MSATLDEVAAALGRVDRRGSGTAAARVVDVVHDSRRTVPGALFCAVPGEHSDGHDHAPAAVEAGAAALLVERWLEPSVPQLRVPSVRRAMGRAAAVVHGHPSRELTVVGVTGTNGKTTVAHLVEAAAGAAGRGTGLIGTVGTRIHGAPQPGARTTPEGTDLQRLLRRMRDRGVEVVAMEVSSHGLALHRVDGTRFAAAVFTNLTRDHLDFHGTMAAYEAAKARLFTPELSRRAVVCVDDAPGRRLAEDAAVPTTTYGTAAAAEHRLRDLEADVDGGRCRLVGPDGEVGLNTRLPGAFNLLNAAAALLASRAVGLDPQAARLGIAACEGVPGRLERVDAGRGPAVFVDYAHTPEALARVLETARGLCPGGRTVVVVGCGGDRDRGKRPRMGAVAAGGADLAVLTSDNPRSEEPARILAAVAAGAREVAGGAEVVEELDRREAIATALRRAGPGDVVVIAGKGHETGQELAEGTVPFDDREVARELLAARRGAAS